MTQIPDQITFRGLAHSEALEAEVREHISWLEQHHPDLVRCRVLLELPHRRRHRDGRHVQVRIEVTFPNTEPIVVSQRPTLGGPVPDDEDVVRSADLESDRLPHDASAAIRRAFAVMRRRLKDATQNVRRAG
jgi:hypothetical protein